MPEKSFGPKLNLSSKKMFVPKNLLAPKKMSGPKNVWSKKNVESSKHFGSEKFGVQKNFGPKFFLGGCGQGVLVVLIIVTWVIRTPNLLNTAKSP